MQSFISTKCTMAHTETKRPKWKTDAHAVNFLPFVIYCWLPFQFGSLFFVSGYVAHRRLVFRSVFHKLIVCSLLDRISLSSYFFYFLSKPSTLEIHTFLSFLVRIHSQFEWSHHAKHHFYVLPRECNAFDRLQTQFSRKTYKLSNVSINRRHEMNCTWLRMFCFCTFYVIATNNEWQVEEKKHHKLIRKQLIWRTLNESQHKCEVKETKNMKISYERRRVDHQMSAWRFFHATRCEHKIQNRNEKRKNNSKTKVDRWLTEMPSNFGRRFWLTLEKPFSQTQISQRQRNRQRRKIVSSFFFGTQINFLIHSHPHTHGRNGNFCFCQ